MTLSHIAGLTDQMVKDCALETASIFFCNRSGNALSLSYLHHVNISAEAQVHYRDHRVFASDPFVRLPLMQDGADAITFHCWGDRRLDPLARDADDYRAFLSMHDVAVVGALSRRISSNLCMVIGTHQHYGRHRSKVPLDMLEHQLRGLSDLVLEHLLDVMLEMPTGKAALRSALPAGEADDDVQDLALSDRELEIVDLICRGKQNKEVAYLLGISRHTVENHLRRIYRKLAIHNRAALVGRMSTRLN